MIRNPYDVYGPVHKESEDDVYYSLNHSEYVPASLLSMIAGGPKSPRQYIDPWDLENYAYLQRQGESDEYGTETVYNSDDGCESTASSQFFYKGSAEKQDYYKPPQYLSADNRSLYACDGSCNSPLCDKNTVYGTQQPQLQFPPPPYEFNPYNDSEESDIQTVMEECQECSLSFEKNHYASSSELYNDPLYSTTTTTPRFSLSKKGLLKIDYSCNWNCLDFNFGHLRL